MSQLHADLGQQNFFAHEGSSTAIAAKPLFDHDQVDHVTHTVTIKRDCDADDEDAHKAKNEFFLVTFSHPIKLSLPNENTQFEPLRRAMDIILKSHFITSGFKAFGRSPRSFYFPERYQDPSLVTGPPLHQGRPLVTSPQFQSLLRRVRTLYFMYHICIVFIILSKISFVFVSSR